VQGKIESVQSLLDTGGSIHIMNEFGETPLHVAALSKVPYLVAHHPLPRHPFAWIHLSLVALTI
jgi:hypothetical protein